MNDEEIRIAGNIFASCMRNAKLTLNYDRLHMDGNGLWIELDGHFDYKGIASSLIGEAKSLQKLADQFSKDLLDNKDSVEQFRDIDVESIDKKQYKLVHDENKNRMYLFLPMEALKTTAKQDKDNATRNEDDGRTIAKIETISSALGKFVGRHKSEAKRIDDNTWQILATDESASDTLDDYNITCQIDRVVGKRNDSIESNLRLIISYESQIIYDKVVKNQFKYGDFGLQPTNQDRNGSIFSATTGRKQDTDKMRNGIQKLTDSINKAEAMGVEAFKKDLITDKARNKFLEQLVG